MSMAERQLELSGCNLAGAYDLNRRYGLLSEEEVLFAVKFTKAKHPDRNLVFIEANFFEATKEDLVKSFLTGIPLPRRVEVITQSLEHNQTLIDIITVPESSSVDCCNENGETIVLQDVQAGLSPDEYIFVEEVCKSYQPLLEAIAKRGLDPNGLVADAWCLGHFGPECDPSERVCWPSLFYRDEDDDIPYGRPIEGIEVRISLTKREIIKFEDTDFGVFPIPGSREAFNSHYVRPENQRKDLKPLVITQPEGPSWTVTDVNTVEWQGWKFQVGFSSREGCVLHGLTLFGRPVLHRFCFSEMVSELS
jgi:primary-amine oxidase